MLLTHRQIRYSKVWRQILISFCLSVLTFLAVVTPQFNAISQTSQKGGIDWVVVIDTSASMRGVGGTKDIFDQVKSTVLDFVNRANIKDSVTIFTFDSETTLRSNIIIESNVDRGNLKQIINALEVNGQRTHIGKAIQDALQYTAQISQRPNAAERTLSILFFTDGREDVRGISNPVPIPTNIRLVQEQDCKPYLFFISLGEQEHEQQLEEFANHPALCNRGQVIRDPGAENLLQDAEKIRQIIEPETSPQPEPSFQSEPETRPQESLTNTTSTRQILWLLIPFFLLFSIILFAFWRINSPGNLIGTLRLIKPQSKTLEDKAVDLTRRKSHKFRLSELFPELANAMQGSDAELKMDRQKANKYPILSVIKGIASVNGIEIATAEIHDGDEIILGDVIVEFNSVAYPRQTIIGEYDEFI